MSYNDKLIITVRNRQKTVPTTTNEAVAVFLNENFRYEEGVRLKADYVHLIFKSYAETEWNNNFSMCDFQCKAAQLLRWFEKGQNSYPVELLTFHIPKSKSVLFNLYHKGDFRNLTWTTQEMSKRYEDICTSEREKLIQSTPETKKILKKDELQRFVEQSSQIGGQHANNSVHNEEGPYAESLRTRVQTSNETFPSEEQILNKSFNNDKQHADKSRG